MAMPMTRASPTTSAGASSGADCPGHTLSHTRVRTREGWRYDDSWAKRIDTEPVQAPVTLNDIESP